MAKILNIVIKLNIPNIEENNKNRKRIIFNENVNIFY